MTGLAVELCSTKIVPAFYRLEWKATKWTKESLKLKTHTASYPMAQKHFVIETSMSLQHSWRYISHACLDIKHNFRELFFLFSFLLIGFFRAENLFKKNLIILTPGDRVPALGGWGYGRTATEWNVFLQDNQDTLLEIQRSQALDRAAISIQRVLRGYKYRYKSGPSAFHTEFFIQRTRFIK